MNVKVYQDYRRALDDGSYKIYLRVTADDKKVFFISTSLSAKYELHGCRFDKCETRWKTKTESLSSWLRKCQEYGDNHPYLPSDELRKELYTLIGKTAPERKEKAFAAFVDEYVKVKVNNKGTASLYRQTKNAIIEFSGVNTSFSDITPQWISKFTEHRLSTGHKQNGISRNLRDIRAVFNFCITKGYTKKYPFGEVSIPVCGTVHRNLAIEQFRNFIAYPCLPFQEKYRDIFLLSFYLWGINIGDLLLLRPIDYHNGYIHYNRQKTCKEYIIKVEPEAEAIINKYRGKNYLLCFMDTNKDYHAFLKHCNKTLQGIGKIHSPGKKPTGTALLPCITTYWARHTVASFAAEIGIPMSTISMGLGHSMSGGASVTQVYVEFQQWMIDDAMRDIIDYVNSGKDSRTFIKEKRLKESGVAEMLQKIYEHIS